MKDREVIHLESKIKLLEAEKEAQEEYAEELEKLLDLDLNKGALYNNKLYDIRIIPAKSNWTWVYRDDKGFWGVELYNEWNRDTVYITSANYYNLGEQVDVS